ncbi:hypothetical protein ACFL3D_04955 [Candidatus Omnitrophota bacterium]
MVIRMDLAMTQYDHISKTCRDMIQTSNTLNNKYISMMRIFMFVMIVLFMAVTMCSAQEDIEHSKALDQQKIVRDFIDKKERLEELLQKQKIYEDLLGNLQRTNAELERIIENEKRAILIRQLNEINKKVSLVNENTNVS